MAKKQYIEPQWPIRKYMFNICAIRIPGEEKEGNTKIFKEIRAKIFQNWFLKSNKAQ